MRLVISSLLLSAGLLAWAGLAAAEHHELPRFESASDAVVYIISPADGETLTGPVRVVFGLRGMGVAPAGTNMPNTGHHHLLVDTPLPDLDTPLPASKNHIHFGKGQTETVLELAPGKHTLQLMLADMNHVPHQPAVISKPVTITVE